ncbi:MAG: uroporphyrinogen decarboxylase family protein [Anaerolineae bacterium]|jgi:uroporphyrinogen decarboxylase
MTMPTTLEETGIQPRPDFTQLERALRRDGTPEYIPLYELFADMPVQEALVGHPLPDRTATIEFYYRAGYDYVPVWPGLPLKLGDLKDTRKGYPISDWQTFESYDWPSTADISFAEYEAVAPRLPDGMRIIAQTGGIFEAAEGLCGYAGLCLLLADDRELVHAIFDRLGELYVAMYSGMASIPEVGAVVISDDLGFKTQTLVSPNDMREFVLPWHKRLAEIAHREGKPCILHSCGQLATIMPDIINDVRIDAKHSFEDSILPVTEAKRLYGDRIALLGGFDVDRLCRSSEEEIREHADMLMDTCGAGGGYALGTGNSVAKFIPLPHYLTMLQQWWRRRQ